MCVNFVIKRARQTEKTRCLAMLVVWNSRWDAVYYWVLRGFKNHLHNHKARSSDAIFRWSNYYAWYLLHVNRTQRFFFDNVRWFSPPFPIADRAQLQVKIVWKVSRLNRKIFFIPQNCDKPEIVNVKHENLSQCAVNAKRENDFE